MFECLIEIDTNPMGLTKFLLSMESKFSFYEILERNRRYRSACESLTSKTRLEFYYLTLYTFTFMNNVYTVINWDICILMELYQPAKITIISLFIHKIFRLKKINTVNLYYIKYRKLMIWYFDKHKGTCVYSHSYFTVREVSTPGSELYVISFRVIFVLERQIHSRDWFEHWCIAVWYLSGTWVWMVVLPVYSQ